MEQQIAEDNLFSLENKYKKTLDAVLENQPKTLSIGVLERVSTDRQADEGDSLEMQRELAQAHAKDIKGVIYRYYTEEGLSAKKVRVEKRVKIQQIKQDILDGKVNYVIAYKRDRMFRNNIEHMQFLQFLADNSCGIFYSARGELQTDLTAFKVAGASKMMETMLSMMAEMESAQTSARVSDTMLSKANRGEYTGGGVPIGYYRDEEGVFRPMPSTKEIVNTIEELYLSGYGYFSIAKWLNGGDIKGLPLLIEPIAKPIDDSKSQIWNHRNIMRILFNPFYTGHTSYESKKNPEMNRIINKAKFIEPIRTIERQRELNELLNKKTANSAPPRQYNTPFLLSGLIHCSECGEKLMTSTTQPKNSDKRHSYYRCKSQTTNYQKAKCDNHGYRKEILEAEILKKAKETVKRFLEPNIYELLKKKVVVDKKSFVGKAESIKKDIKEKEKELTGYAKMIAKLEMEEKYDQQKVFLQAQAELLNEINDLKETHAILLEKGEGEEDTFDIEKFLDLAQTFGDVIEESPVGIQKQMLENLFSNIRINKHGEVSMRINAGLTEAILPSHEEADIDDSTEVIFFGTGGSPMVTKDITTVVDSFGVTFNYYDYTDEISSYVYESFEKYLVSLDRLLDMDNAYEIDTSDLKSYKGRYYKDEDLIKKSINSIYIIEVYGVSYYSLEKFRSGKPLGIETMERMLNVAETDMEEFVNFLCKMYPDKMINNIEAVETIINSTKGEKWKARTKAKDKESLFKDRITCSCGETMLRRKNIRSTYYKCKKMIYRKGKGECITKSIKEKDIVNEIFERTGFKIRNKEEADKFVESIVVLDEKGTFKINYRF